MEDERNARTARIDSMFDDVETLGGNWTKALQESYGPIMTNPTEEKARFANQYLLAQYYDRTPEEIGSPGYEIHRDEYARREFGGIVPKTDLEFFNAYRVKRDKDKAVTTLRADMASNRIASALKDAANDIAPDWGTRFGEWRDKNGTNPAFKDIDPQATPIFGDGEQGKSVSLGMQYRDGYMAVRRFMNEHPELKAITKGLIEASGRHDVFPPRESAPDGIDLALATTDLGILPYTPKQSIRESLFDGPALMNVSRDLAKVPQEARLQYLELVKHWMATDQVKDPDGILMRIGDAAKQTADSMNRGADVSWGSAREARNGDARAAQILKDIDNNSPIYLRGGVADLSHAMTEAEIERYQNLTNSDGLTVEGAQFQAKIAPERFGIEASPEAREEIRQQATQSRELYQTFRDVYRIAKTSINPMRPVLATSKLGQEIETEALYGTAEFAPVMAAAGGASMIHPLAGWAVMADAMESQFYNEAVDSGMSADSAQLFSASAAAIAGGAGILRVNALKGAGWLAARWPGLRAVVADAAIPSGQFAAKFIGRTALGTAEQSVDMAMIAAAPEAAKWLMQGLAQDIPETKFSQIADAMGEAMESPGTWFAALPFALVGAGVAGFHDFRTVQASLGNRDILAGAGFSKDYQDKIIEAHESGDQQKAMDLYKEGYKVRTKKDIIAGQELQKQEAESAEALQKSPETPTITAEGDRWVVTESDGSRKVYFDSYEEAKLFVDDNIEWGKRSNESAIRSLVDWYQGKDENRKWEVSGKEKTGKDAIESGESTPEQLAERMRIEGIQEGDPANTAVLGENIAEIKDNLYTDTSRIHQGADPLTVAEERTHSQFEKELHEGTVSMDQARDMTKLWADKTGFRLADPKNPPLQEIKEAVGDMGKSHFVGELRRGGEFWKSLPSPVRSFIVKMAAYFREVFRRAKQLQELRAEGKLPKEWQDFLSRSIGIDEQLNHNRTVEKAVVGIAGDHLADASKMVGEPSYSIGKIKDRSDVWNKPGVAVVKIDSSKLPGQKKDWHKAIRQWFSDNLQGKVIANDHSGLKIKFNSESRSESVGKLRHEEAFRSLKNAEDIVKEALYLDSSKAEDMNRSNAYHYFTVPVEVDGKTYAAWFNVREPKVKDSNSDGVFYEFGVDTKNELASARPVTDHRLNPEGIASTSKPTIPIPQFLESVKGAWLIMFHLSLETEATPSLPEPTWKRLPRCSTRCRVRLKSALR